MHMTRRTDMILEVLWQDLQELLSERMIQEIAILRYIQYPTVAEKFSYYMINPFVEVKLLSEFCGTS